MSRLEELIKELCPEGVECIEIGKIVKYEQSAKYVVSSTKYDGAYATPVLTAGQTFVLGYTNEKDGIYAASKKDPIIIFDDFTGAFKWVDFPFKVKSTVIKLLSVDKRRADLRYIFHVMEHINYTSVEHKRLWIGTYSYFRIPLPPLSIQAEIVRVLDNFTTLTVELTAELTARKMQYEYYRDKLLTFDAAVERKKLGELFAYIRNGVVGTVTPYFTDNKHGVRYLEGRHIHNGFISNDDELYVTREFHKKHMNSELKAGDILMVQSGHVGESAVVGEEFSGANCHALIIMSNGGTCNSKFINYYFQSSEGKRKLKKISTGGAVKHILASEIKNYMVPVPPLPVQQRIVKILDNFDTLCNDPASGLPAEIGARQKQYEYYRDKLLSFKEKQA